MVAVTILLSKYTSYFMWKDNDLSGHNIQSVAIGDGQ